MKTDTNNFSKRLDKIFEMGDPTKALIIDAFIKVKPNVLTDEMIDKMSDDADEEATQKGYEMIFSRRSYEKGMKAARDFITGVPESLKQQIINLSIGERLDLLDEFCSYCGDIESEKHTCPTEKTTLN